MVFGAWIYSLKPRQHISEMSWTSCFSTPWSFPIPFISIATPILVDQARIFVGKRTGFVKFSQVFVGRIPSFVKHHHFCTREPAPSSSIRRWFASWPPAPPWLGSQRGSVKSWRRSSWRNCAAALRAAPRHRGCIHRCWWTRGCLSCKMVIYHSFKMEPWVRKMKKMKKFLASKMLFLRSCWRFVDLQSIFGSKYAGARHQPCSKLESSRTLRWRAGGWCFDV